MTAVERIVFRVTTPSQSRIFQTFPPALLWFMQEFFSKAWADGYKVTWELIVAEGELPEDTDWLERRLGGPDA